jgi:two-component system, sensor histidine kinase and response regulator
MNPGKLLARQLRRAWGLQDPAGLDAVVAELAAAAAHGAPGLSDAARAAMAGMGRLLQAVDDGFSQSDRDLDLIRRSLDLSSAELRSCALSRAS